MKNFILLLTCAFSFMACQGPEGPPGLNGRDGVNIVAQSFEFTTDFFAPDYSHIEPIPNTIPTTNDDMILTYILWDEIDGNDGGLIDNWRLLPQVLYSPAGEFQYNYDATNGDVNVFIDAPATTNLGLLNSGDLDGQTFRSVVLPVELANIPGFDASNYSAVLNAVNNYNDELMSVE